MVNNYPTYYPTYPNYQQYQQPMQAISQPVTTPQPIQNQLLAWVKDEKEGIDYPLSPGQSIFLMNQNESYLYAKSVDQLGKITFIKKRLVDETETAESKLDLREYIRREELENLISDKIQKEVEKRVSQISFKPTRKKSVVVDEDEE